MARPKRTRSARRVPPQSRTRQLRTVEAASTRALHALRLMRSEGVSLTAAVRRSHTSARTVKKYAGSALRHVEGHYLARTGDTLPRMMRFVTRDGIIALRVRSSRQASRIARYWTAVQRYLLTGHTDALRAFRGRAVRTGKVGYPFITDPRTLERLAQAGEVRFEELYVHAA